MKDYLFVVLLWISAYIAISFDNYIKADIEKARIEATKCECANTNEAKCEVKK